MVRRDTVLAFLTRPGRQGYREPLGRLTVEGTGGHTQ